MKICAMVAAASNGTIGKDNDLPWHLPDDLKYFKKTTSGFPVIMGRKCYESIGRPLPKRKNIIISRNPEYKVEGCVVVNSMSAAYMEALEDDKEKCFILGGGEIYRMTHDDWDLLYLTRVHADIEGDVFFDLPDESKWSLISKEEHEKDERHDYAFSFEVYEPKEQ